MYFDAREVENLRKVFNKENPKVPVRAGDPTLVWKNIQSRLHDKCDNSTECVMLSLMSKPTAPNSWRGNPEEWLSSTEIDAIEKQYTKVFSEYFYVGTVPIDFDKKSLVGTCVVSSLCSMDIKSIYKKGYRQIGIVFNTDKSSGPGEHWIALFCDIRPELDYPRITYFDSYADKPEKEVQALMKRWAQSWNETGVHSKPMQITYNKTRHQYQHSECGMYSLYFHLCCLTGTSMKSRIPDQVIRGFRGLLFKV